MDPAPRLCVVGPLPPPGGGMANQCEQLVRLLRAEGLQVEVVRNNEPYRPAFVARLPGLRALARLLPYLARLWVAIGRAEVVHVLANSGWAFHLFAWPAMCIARLRGRALVLNYRGGLADEFLQQAPRHVHRALAAAELRVAPSAFIQRVFAKHGLQAEVVPNIIDLTRFRPREAAAGDAPHLIVTRHLEPIYDIATALRAFALVRRQYPQARLSVAGRGPERERLEQLATELGIADAVHFCGALANAEIAGLYAEAALMLNPSTVDNMPISILEALASGVPVVSTAAGGIPDLVRDGQTALLVPIGDAEAMAAASLRVLSEPGLARALREAGLAEVQRYAWPQVFAQWRSAYRRAAQSKVAAA